MDLKKILMFISTDKKDFWLEELLTITKINN